MRVLLLANHYRQGPGGAEAVLLATEALLRERGHEPVPFAVREPGTAPTSWAAWFPPSAGAGARTEPGRRLAATASRPARDALERLLDAARPDVAHVHHVFEGLTLSVVEVLLARRVPVVMTLHDYKPVCPNYRLYVGGRPCQRCLGGRYWNVVVHGCLEGPAWRGLAAAADAYRRRLGGLWERVDLFLAPSRYLRDQVVAGGLPAARVTVLPNPVAVPPDPPPPGVGAGPARFVYTGRLVAEKGLDDLLTAAGALRGLATVEVFGEGRLAGVLRSRVDREGLPVGLHGFAGRDRLAVELAAAGATVLPARWPENCPLAILEAAARAVPAVATAVGGIPELVEHGRTGLLVPPGDPAALAAAMAALARHPGRAAELGRAARQRVAARHDLGGHADALLDCYRRAIARAS
jgi:glycosyltransferase involved in cell wall biosynthesis